MKLKILKDTYILYIRERGFSLITKVTNLSAFALIYKIILIF